MERSELKHALHEAVEASQEDARLEEALAILKNEPTADWWQELTPEQQANIRRAQEEMRTGRFRTHEEVMGSAFRRF